MKRLLMILALSAGLIEAQQVVQLTAAPPPSVQGLGAAVVGTPGTTFACYWLVVNYVGGGVLSAAPVCLPNIPNTLSSGNYVQVSWQAATGTNVTYDLLKTTTTTPPAAGASSSLATALTVTTSNDQGGSLSAYTIAPFPYASGIVQVSINNRDFVYPAFECAGATGFPCQATFGQIVPKGTLGVIKLGGCSSGSPLTIDKTGAAYITEGSCAPGSAVGPIVAGVTYSVSANVTLAQVNAGITILPLVTGQTYKVNHFLLTAVGGTTAGCTSVNISDTTGTPVNAAAVAVAALTSGVPVDETITGVTLTAFAPTALTASQGIQLRHVGSACTTSTSFNVVVFFTINS
jgi:hypothetical protein